MFETVDGAQSGGRRGPARGRSLLLGWAGIGLLLAGMLAYGGCAREPKDAVVSLKGWSLNLSQLQSEYDRVNGAGSFNNASQQDRENFARTLADKQILLGLSHKTYPALVGKQARIYRVMYEKGLQMDYLKYRRGLFKLSSEQFTQSLPLVSRKVTVRIAHLPSKDVGAQVHDAQAAGKSFEEIANAYATDMPDAPGTPKKVGGGPRKWQELTVDLSDSLHRSPPWLVMQGLLRNLPEGDMTGPVDAQGAIFIGQIEKYLPLDRPADSLFARKIRPKLENIAYMPVSQQWMDSLRTAYHYALHPESYPILMQRMATFWDSINAAPSKGLTVDFQALRGPVWLFPPEEQRQPCFDLGGKTWTVGDFVESLNRIDLEYWPTIGDVAKIAFQVEGRVIRLLIQTEAEKTGFPKNPEFAAKMHKLEEQGFLNQYFDGLVGKESEPTPEEIKATYDADSNAYVFNQQVSFSALIYPEAKKARAEAALAKLRAGGSLLWLDLAPAEAKSDPSITYLAAGQPMDVMKVPKDPLMAALLKAARATETGKVSDLVAGKGTVSIVRTQQRTNAGRETLQQAASGIRQRLGDAKREHKIEEVLTAERKRQGLVVHTDRLGGAPPAKA